MEKKIDEEEHISNKSFTTLLGLLLVIVSGLLILDLIGVIDFHEAVLSNNGGNAGSEVKNETKSEDTFDKMNKLANLEFYIDELTKFVTKEEVKNKTYASDTNIKAFMNSFFSTKSYVGMIDGITYENDGALGISKNIKQEEVDKVSKIVFNKTLEDYSNSETNNGSVKNEDGTYTMKKNLATGGNRNVVIVGYKKYTKIDNGYIIKVDYQAYGNGTVIEDYGTLAYEVEWSNTLNMYVITNVSISE